MKIHTPLVVIGFLLSTASSAFAVNFSGHWIANSGTVTDSKGNQSSCSQVEIVIEHSANSIKIIQYKAKCGLMQPDWGPYTMRLDGDRVFEDDEEIGTIEGNIMKTLSSSGGVQYAFNLRLSQAPDGSPLLESYYGVRNLVGAIVIEGALKPL